MRNAHNSALITKQFPILVENDKITFPIWSRSKPPAAAIEPLLEPSQLSLKWSHRGCFQNNIVMIIIFKTTIHSRHKFVKLQYTVWDSTACCKIRRISSVGWSLTFSNIPLFLFLHKLSKTTANNYLQSLPPTSESL